jgi:hypothetical protein
MGPERGALGRDDAAHHPLQFGVHRRFDVARTAPREAVQHPFDKMRRDERRLGSRRRVDEMKALTTRVGFLRKRQPSRRGHRGQDAALPRHGAIRCAPRVEVARLLRQCGEKRRLGGGEPMRRTAEVCRRRTRDALNLIAVRCEIQIERENLVFRQPMFEPQCDEGLAKLGTPAISPGAGLTLEQQFSDLLRNRRAAFNDPARSRVSDRGANDGDRIHAWVPAETAILGGFGRVYEMRREMCRIEDLASQPRGGPRLVQTLAMPIDDDRRWLQFAIEQRMRNRADANPDERHDTRENCECGHASRRTERFRRSTGGDRACNDARDKEAWIHLISIVAAAARPCTSGAYMASTSVPAVRNVPDVVARTM